MNVMLDWCVASFLPDRDNAVYHREREREREREAGHSVTFYY